MIIIADSGSTKTHWEIINEKTKEHRSVFSRGINPFYQSESEITAIIKNELKPYLNAGKLPDRIYFYGAGCSQPDRNEVVSSGLGKVFKDAEIEVEHDLLAAARATCGKQAGVSAILGTGSNSCLFDGKRIVDNIPSLGFQLGDEGSGAWFGRKLLQAYYYRELPGELQIELETEYDMEKSRVLKHVYDKPMPNQYIASFAKFISKHNEHPFFMDLLKHGFREFLDRHVKKYVGHEKLPVHFVGSVAFFNKDILLEVLSKYKLKTGVVLRGPMEGLLNYHLESNN